MTGSVTPVRSASPPARVRPPGPRGQPGSGGDADRGPRMAKRAPLWLDLAVPPVPRRLTQDRNHLIVCGDDALAYRVVEELTTNYGERVTVLLSARARGHGPRIARLPGVRVIERPSWTATRSRTRGPAPPGRSP